MKKDINVSYAKTVYGQKEIDAVVKCLNEGTQMSKYASEFEKKLLNYLKKHGILLILDHLLYILEWKQKIFLKEAK